MTLAATIFAVFLSTPSFADGLKKIPIALISEKPRISVDAPNYLPFLLKASHLAVEERKDEFRRLGIEVVVREYLTMGGTPESRQVMESALQGDTVGAVGIFSDDDAVLMVPSLPGSNYFVVSPYATGTDLLKFSPNFLEYSPPNAALAKALEKFVLGRIKPKRIVAIVAWDSANSRDFYAGLSQGFKKRITLVKTLEDLANVKDTVASVLSTEPDVILLPNYPVCSATLIKNLADAGFRGTFIGTDSWGEGVDPRFMKMTGGASFDAYVVRPLSRFDLTEREAKFSKHILKGTGIPHPSSTGLFYDATNYLLDLIARVGPSVDRAKVLQLAVQTRQYSGITGKSCLSKMECPGRVFRILHVTQAGFQFEGRFTPQTGEGISKK